ncbi:MAG: DUF1826 domain-containing protein [Telmatospirillum sp.]|nr:DUF1826 domain-containing protein [Telmatospirillum sp.]
MDGAMGACAPNMRAIGGISHGDVRACGPIVDLRCPAEAVRRAVAALRFGPDPSFEFPADCEDVLAELVRRVADAALAADMADIAHAYAARTGAARQKLRFARIVGPGCKFFHVDMVELRAITTYAGEGTEYVEASDVDRAALGSGDNRRIVPDPTKVKRLPLYAVGYFRGEADLAHAGTGHVHRSPPASPHAPRLLFVVDRALDADG